MPTKLLLNNTDDTKRIVHSQRIEQAQQKAIPEREINRLAKTFKILGDQTRIKIVMALRGGEMCVCDLAAFLDISESAVSHQLRRLKDLELIKHRRDGQTLYYSLDDDHVSDLFNLCLEHVRE